MQTDSQTIFITEKSLEREGGKDRLYIILIANSMIIREEQQWRDSG